MLFKALLERVRQRNESAEEEAQDETEEPSAPKKEAKKEEVKKQPVLSLDDIDKKLDEILTKEPNLD